MTHLPLTRSQKRPQPCVMRVVRVSGTIKKAEEEAIRRAKASIMKAKRDEGGGGVDGLLGMLGEEEEQSLGKGKGKGKSNAGSDASDDDDDVAINSQEDG